MNNPDFETELQRLHEALQGFDEMHELQVKDPSVERLLEGAAYLSAQMRQLVDSKSLEISEALLMQVSPELLQPIPSATILELIPKAGQLFKTVKIKKGAIVKSRCIIETENIQCQFSINEDVMVHPIKVDKVEYSQNLEFSSQISLRLQLLNNVDPVCLNSDPLLFYLNADYRSACELYVFLTRRINAISYQFDDQKEQRCAVSNPLSVRPKNFANNENTGEPFNHIKNFFASPEKYFFISLVGLNQLSIPRECDCVKITLFSESSLSQRVQVSQNLFKLNCVSADNLFEVSSEPIPYNYKQTEYPLVPYYSSVPTLAIHSIKEVCGISYVTGAKEIYKSFAAINTCEREAKYQKITRMDKFGCTRDYLKVSGGNISPEDVISCLLNATNANLPNQYLLAGEEFVASHGVPDVITVKNCIQPTHYLTSPALESYDWYLIGHLLLRLNSLCDVNYCKLLLSHLNWSRNGHIKKYINGIKKIATDLKQTVSKGISWPLLIIVIEIDKTQFSTEHEIYVFSEVVQSLFGSFIQINSCFQLNITFDDGSPIVFGIRHGGKKLL